jgi:phenylacetic acid degradation operon negative regulatory protein
MQEAGRSLGDMLFVFSLPYGTSLSRMLYLLDRRQNESERINIDKRVKRNFSDFIYRLKRDGLVSHGRKGKFFMLTSKGRELLRDLRSKNLPHIKYGDNQAEDTWKIFIFDIPERERYKRNWLRMVLRNLNFKMLQKSVWLGKTALPQEFINDLKKIELISYIEIFCITKKGSLRQIA